MARPAERMNSAQKRELAIEFIRKIRAMDRNKLHELILGEAGEELAQFFLMYATDLMMREPQRATENASSLLLIGYLLLRWLYYKPAEPETQSAGPEPSTQLGDGAELS